MTRIGIPGILLIMHASVVSQPLYDRDFRMRNPVPMAAIDFIEACGLNGKIKWYKEYEGSNVSLEAKTRMHGSEYSVEFDTLGNLKDVELRINFDEIPFPAQTVIRDYLNSAFTQYRIVKAQYQWSGENSALQKLITHQYTNQPHTTHYELVVLGKDKKFRNVYDLLFDQDGTLINIERTPPRNTDHLDF